MSLVLFCFVLLMMFGSTFWLDPDLGWHLFLGRKIIENQTLIHSAIGYNYFSNISLPDHEWLSDVFLFCLSKVGYWAIYVIFALTTASLVFLLLKIIKKHTKNNLTIIVAISLTSLVLTMVYGIRLQIILLLAATLFVYIFEYVKSQTKRWWLYAILTIIGINLHGGFLTILPIPLLLEFPNKEIVTNKVFTWLKLLVLLSASTLVNPYGLKFWHLAGQYASSRSYLSMIAEWQPVFNFPTPFLNCIFPLTLMIFVFCFNNYWRKIPFNKLILYIFYFIIGIEFRRFFPIFAIIILPDFVLAIDDLKEKILTNQKIQKNIDYFLITCVVLALLFNCKNSFTNISNPLSDKNYPVAASEFLAQNLPKESNLFNKYDWGGFLLWQNQDIKVFIDGRGPQATVAQNTSILDEYKKFNDGNTDIIREQLDKYDISAIIINSEKPAKYDLINQYILDHFVKLDQSQLIDFYHLHQYLKNSPDWQKVYEDDIAQIYFKK